MEAVQKAIQAIEEKVRERIGQASLESKSESKALACRTDPPLITCRNIQNKPFFAMCDLRLGHTGAHAMLDKEGKVVKAWSNAWERCRELHPDGKVSCDLHGGHSGDHVDYDNFGRERSRWVVVKAAPLIEVVSSELQWVKNLNPKMFKTPGRSIASERCKTASRIKHKECTEPWCECPCHDEDEDRVDQLVGGRCQECQHIMNLPPFHNVGCSKHRLSRRQLPMILT